MSVEARADLALDPRAQGSQQEIQLNADLNTVLHHRHGPGGAGPLEAQFVSFPGVRSPEFVLESTRQRLRETLGPCQSQDMLATDDDHGGATEHITGAFRSFVRSTMCLAAEP
jgi:hypothetical protein